MSFSLGESEFLFWEAMHEQHEIVDTEKMHKREMRDPGPEILGMSNTRFPRERLHRSTPYVGARHDKPDTNPRARVYFAE